MQKHVFNENMITMIALYEAKTTTKKKLQKNRINMECKKIWLIENKTMFKKQIKN